MVSPDENPSAPAGPAPVNLWRDEAREWGVEVGFVGRETEPRPDRQDQIARLAPRARPPLGAAWARQVHSGHVLPEARTPGDQGEGDALVTRASGLALSIVTADCLPVLFASPRGIAAAHAGWRGLVAGILPATVAALRGAAAAPEGAAELRVWIGPAIGPCCYEVGDEVVERVLGAPSRGESDCVRPGPRGRPHLDLVAVARTQLVLAGVVPAAIRVLGACTRCQGDRLWSYRRDGPGTGRNTAWIWRSLAG